MAKRKRSAAIIVSITRYKRKKMRIILAILDKPYYDMYLAACRLGNNNIWPIDKRNMTTSRHLIYSY